MPEHHDTGGVSVLVVEQDTESRVTLEAICAALHTPVITAATADEAVAASRSRRPAVVVVDLDSTQAAQDVVRAMREPRPRSRTPVVGLTHRARPGTAHGDQAPAGCDAYLGLPLRPLDAVYLLVGILYGATAPGCASP